MACTRRFLPFTCLTLLLAAGCAGDAPPRTSIVVEAAYPGADAQSVVDAVAAPIEQQVNGVEKLESMKSRCTSDGRYVLTLTFADGVDAAMAQVLVQNRVALALPLVPQLVQHGGVTVKKKPRDVQYIVSLSSKGDRFDAVWLSNYARIQLKDELARLLGVGEVSLLPVFDNGMRVWLDPGKLAAYKMTAAEVARAIQKENLGVDQLPAIAANEFRIDIRVAGRLIDLEGFVAKTTAGGEKIRLRDLARVERMNDRRDDQARLNGKDVALLLIAPTQAARPGDLTAAVKKMLAQAKKNLPEGLELELAFDFSAGLQKGKAEHLLFELDLPDGASSRRAADLLNRCEKVVRDLDGVKDVLILSDTPFDGGSHQPGILVRLAPPSDRTANPAQRADALRTQLQEEIAGAVVRVRVSVGTGPFAAWSYPIELIVHGPEAAQVRKLAMVLSERLKQEKKLTDVWVDRATGPRPQVHIHVDKEQARKLGVKLADLQLVLESLAGAGVKQQIEDFKRLKVRNDKREMVALSAVAKASEVNAPDTIDRFDMRPMVRITANPAPGVALAEARAVSATLTQRVREELKLPADYRVIAVQK